MPGSSSFRPPHVPPSGPESGQIWSSSGHLAILVEFGPMSLDSGRMLVDFGRHRPTSIDLGWSLADLGQRCPIFGQLRPTLVKFSQVLAQIGPVLAECQPSFVDFGIIWANSWSDWSKSGHIRSILGHIWSNLAGFGQKRSSSAEIWSMLHRLQSKLSLGLAPAEFDQCRPNGPMSAKFDPIRPKMGEVDRRRALPCGAQPGRVAPPIGAITPAQRCA